MSTANNVNPPDPNDTVLWLRVTFDHLKDIKPGSELAKQILCDATVYESAWRPAYVNALERTVANPALMLDEDAPISAPETVDGEDGAYVMCWHFIPHSAVIPPNQNPTPQELTNSLGRLKAVADNLDFQSGAYDATIPQRETRDSPSS
jgi:hypothetical protein